VTGYTWAEGWATVFATASMGSIVTAIFRQDYTLAYMGLAFVIVAACAFAWPWVSPVLVSLVGASRSLLATGGTRLKCALRERRHRTHLVRVLAVSHPDTHIALVSRHLDDAVGTVLLHRLTLTHIRPTTTHVGLYATAPWRRVVAVYEVESIEAVEDGYLVKLGQGGHLIQPLPLAVACGLTRPPTPVRYLPDVNAHVLSGALMKGTT
jgi:hypothetical protein